MNIESLMNKKKDLNKAMLEHGKAALKEEFKNFFAAHPECKALRWTQYTPYFNDGEPCTFSRGEFTANMQDTAEDAGDDGDGFDYLYGDEFKKGGKYEAASKAIAALEDIDADIYKMVFDDHVQVTATKDGFEVEEYSHD